MHTLQLSFANPNRDRFGSQPARFELPPRHHSVLPSGELGHRRIGGVAFCIHMDA
jgi:hypothetical protein